MAETKLDGLGLDFEWELGNDAWKPGMDSNLVMLNRLALATVIDILSTPPVSPAQNDAYIVGASATGAWLGMENEIAVWDNNNTAWRFTNGPKVGWMVYDQAAVGRRQWNGSSWVQMTYEASKTLTVGASGFDFTTITAALGSLAPATIKSGEVITIEIQDEVITEANNIDINHPNQNAIQILGKTTYPITITSVLSSSGVAGNWSITVSVTDSSNAAIGNYLFVSNASGGTNPNELAGSWKITAIPAAGQLTITNTSFASAASSGAVTATAVICPSGVKFTNTAEDAFIVNNGLRFGLFDKLFLEGSDNTATGVHSAFAVNGSGSVIVTGPSVGISNFKTGLFLNLSASMESDQIHISNCFRGIQSANNSTVRANLGISNGNVDVGVNVQKNGFAQISGVVSGNQNSGYTVSKRSLGIPQVNCKISGNGIGLFAERGSWIDAVGSVVSGNTTDYSPLPNTVGNEEAYIDT